MSEINTNELLAALQQQLGTMQQPAAAAATGWTQTQQSSAPAGLIQGCAIPIKIDTPMGSVRVYLSLPAQVAQDPQALLGAIQMLANQGYPLDAWQPKSSGGNWGNGGGGGYNRGGGYGNRGGYGGGRW